jgi:polar amino acid transport system substrate-binding protein
MRISSALGYLIVLLAAALLPISSDARSIDDIIKSGTVRIGVATNQPPISFYGKTNELEGFDIDIGNRIAQGLKVKAEFVAVETPERIPFLVSDRIDICLQGLTRTSERAKLITYTVPLMTEAMAVLTTDKVKLTSWRDFDRPDITLVDQRGNNSVDLLKKLLPQAKMILVESVPDMIRSVAQGRADAIIENLDFFMGTAKSFPDVKWKVLPEVIDIAYDGIGVQHGNYPLRDYLNVLLYEMHTSNFVNESWEKWFGAPMTKKIEPQPYF